MKTFTFLILLCFLDITLSNAQTNMSFPALQELEKMSLLKSNDDFYLVAKKFDFNFEAKKTRPYGTDYVYTRDIKVNGEVHIDRIIYQYFDKAGVALIQLVTARVDLFKLYQPIIDTRYKPTTCKIDTESNSLVRCYRNENYYMLLTDVRKQFSNNTTGNSYSISINPHVK